MEEEECQENLGQRSGARPFLYSDPVCPFSPHNYILKYSIFLDIKDSEIVPQNEPENVMMMTMIVMMIKMVMMVMLDDDGDDDDNVDDDFIGGSRI